MAHAQRPPPGDIRVRGRHAAAPSRTRTRRVQVAEATPRACQVGRCRRRWGDAGPRGRRSPNGRCQGFDGTCKLSRDGTCKLKGLHPTPYSLKACGEAPFTGTPYSESLRPNGGQGGRRSARHGAEGAARRQWRPLPLRSRPVAVQGGGVTCPPGPSPPQAGPVLRVVRPPLCARLESRPRTRAAGPGSPLPTEEPAGPGSVGPGERGDSEGPGRTCTGCGAAPRRHSKPGRDGPTRTSHLQGAVGYRAGSVAHAAPRRADGRAAARRGAPPDRT